MTMKILVLFIMIAALIGGAQAAYYGESPRILVTLASQDPDPVEPGKIAELSFKIDNQGAIANNAMVELMPEYPFTLLPGESALKGIGSLSASQDGERVVFVKYKVKTDQNAVDGNYEVKIRHKSDDYDSWVTTDDLIVKVQSKEAILSVEKFNTVPEVVAPGSKAQLMMILNNQANSILKDIKVVLDLGSSGNEATPFAPVGSTNEKVISIINAKESVPLEFDVVVDSNAKSQVYKVPLRLQYSDILNKNYSKTLTVAMIVGGEPDISVYIDSTTLYTAGKTGEVTVKLVNKGLTDIKFLNVNLEKAQGYKVLSPLSVYIGNIDSDDYETVDFKVNADKTSKDKIVLPLSIEYKDANNQDYKKKVNLELAIYTESEAKRLGLVKGGSASSYIIVIIVAVVLFFAYRFWKRRKK